MDSKPTVTLQEKIYIYPMDDELERQHKKGGKLQMPEASVVLLGCSQLSAILYHNMT